MVDFASTGPQELPKDRIVYSKKGDVKGVETFTLVNQQYISETKYHKERNKFFQGGFCDLAKHSLGPAKPVDFNNLPEIVQKIFQAGTKEGVKKLRKKNNGLSSYVDATSFEYS
jgi:hypothetical protein